MNIICTSDLHIGKTNREININDSIKNDFKKVVSTVINKKADLFMIAGDIFDINRPSPDDYTFLINQLKRLNKAQRTTRIIVGNHEVSYTKGRKSALQPIKSIGFKYVSVIDKCCVEDVTDNVSLLYAPYIPESSIDSSKKELNSYYGETLHKLHEQMDKSKFNIFLSHLDVSGCEYSTEFVPRTVRAGVPDFIFNSDKLDLAVNGHIHKYQVIKRAKYPFIVCGSLSHTKFSEDFENKFFIELEVG